VDVLAFSLCFSLLALALHPSARGLVPDSGLGTPHSVRVVCVQPFPEWQRIFSLRVTGDPHIPAASRASASSRTPSRTPTWCPGTAPRAPRAATACTVRRTPRWTWRGWRRWRTRAGWPEERSRVKEVRRGKEPDVCRLRTGRAMGHPPGPRLGAGARAEARHVRPQVAAHSAAHTRLRQPTQRVNLGHRGVEE
jgi:hypothetical protein